MSSMSRLSASVGFSPMRWKGARKMPNFMPLCAIELDVNTPESRVRSALVVDSARGYGPRSHPPPSVAAALSGQELGNERDRCRECLREQDRRLRGHPTEEARDHDAGEKEELQVAP